MKEKLKELYQNGQAGITPCISANGLLKAVANGWITLDDAVEIIGGEDTLPIVRAAKLKEISIACNETIANLFRVVELGGTEFPYQADGGVCRIYTASEIATIYIAAQTLITTQTTYHNELKAYVQSLDSVEAITSIVYGMTLPDPYNTEMNEKLAVANEQMQAIIARLSSAANA